MIQDATRQELLGDLARDRPPRAVGRREALVVYTLDEFLRQFPAVFKEQAVTALDAARDSLLAGAHTS